MARKRKAVEAPNAILSARQDSDDDLATYCPDLDQWPKSWRVEDRDLLPGQQLVEVFKRFLRHLLSLDLSPKTGRKHRDNLWLRWQIEHTCVDPRRGRTSISIVLSRPNAP
jgi:hypothetical protein